jgi:hypothetical protein
MDSKKTCSSDTLFTAFYFIPYTRNTITGNLFLEMLQILFSLSNMADMMAMAEKPSDTR